MAKDGTKSTLLTMRRLWRGSSDSMGYAHPSLVFAACKLIDPPPTDWRSFALWNVFYDPEEIKDVSVDIQWIFQRGFRFYKAFVLEQTEEREDDKSLVL